MAMNLDKNIYYLLTYLTQSDHNFYLVINLIINGRIYYNMNKLTILVVIIRFAIVIKLCSIYQLKYE